MIFLDLWMQLLNDSGAKGAGDNSAGGVHFQFSLDFFDVHLDGKDADAERVGDHFCGKVIAEALDNVPFAQGERLRGQGRSQKIRQVVVKKTHTAERGIGHWKFIEVSIGCNGATKIFAGYGISKPLNLGSNRAGIPKMNWSALFCQRKAGCCYYIIAVRSHFGQSPGSEFPASKLFSENFKTCLVFQIPLAYLCGRF